MGPESDTSGRSRGVEARVSRAGVSLSGCGAAAAMLTACVTIPAARFSAPATLAAECTFVRFC